MSRRCEGGVIEEICLYCEKTEVPALFALWSGVFAVAACLKRDCFIDQAHFMVYPNMYISLTAGSGICRKSTAINIVEDALKQVDPSLNILSQRLTPSDLMGTLSRMSVKDKTKIINESSGVFINDELATLIDKTNEMKALTPLLTKLYDCKDFEYGTRKYGKEMIMNPCLSILGGSTAEWIKDTFPSQAIGGGFVARFVFVFQEKRERNIPWLVRDEENVKRFERVVGDLNEIAKLRGPMGVSEEAIQLYSEEYNKFLEGGLARDSLTTRYAERRHVHLLKLAMALSASQKDTREINKEDMWKAIQIIKTSEGKRSMLMRRIVSTPTGDMCEHVMILIMQAGSIHRARLIYKTRPWITHKELDVILEGLCESGHVRSKVVAGEKIYEYTPRRENGEMK